MFPKNVAYLSQAYLAKGRLGKGSSQVMNVNVGKRRGETIWMPSQHSLRECFLTNRNLDENGGGEWKWKFCAVQPKGVAN